METLATLVRYMQFYAHIAHNICSGNTFFPDHEFFAELYNAYEAHYDSIVERAIGLGLPMDLFKVHNGANQLLTKSTFTNTTQAITKLMEAEKLLGTSIEKELEGKSEGTRQLLGEIMNQSEMRMYKMQQRVKN